MMKRFQPATKQSERWTLAGIMISLALLVLIIIVRQAPPLPKGPGIPPEQFSAGRAVETLERVLGDEAPHPVGSTAHAQVRERILSEIRSIGLEPEMQVGWNCYSPEPNTNNCAYLSNILARLPGLSSEPAVMLAAHYDSVGAGPGAADDGSGIAVALETARAWQRLGPAHRPLILLIDDGEELGMMGARLFLEHSWAREVGQVINLEARGSRGLPVMFETGPNNCSLIAAYRAGAARPTASSLFYSAYEMLSNDTDLSIFKDAGYTGLNFALISNAQTYHTPLDDLQNLDLGGLQMEGETVLNTTRRLAEQVADDLAKEDVAYFDVLGFVMLTWPVGMTIWLAVAGLLMVSMTINALMKTWVLRPGGVGYGLLAAVLSLLGFALAGWAIPLALQLFTEQEMPWFDQPEPTRWSIFMTGLAISLLVGRSLARRAEAWGLGLGAWLLYTLLAVGAALAQPAAASILVVPGLVAGLSMRLVVVADPKVAGRRREAAFGLPLAAAVVILIPQALFFEAASGYMVGFVIGLMFGLALIGMLPFLALPGDDQAFARWLNIGLAVAALGTVIWALFTPAFSMTHPMLVNYNYVEDRTNGNAYWWPRAGLGELPQEVTTGRDFEQKPIFPWNDTERLVTSGVSSGAPAPGVELLHNVVDGDQRLVTVRLQSSRKAGWIEFYVLLDNLVEVILNGSSLPFNRDPEHSGLYLLECFATECDGLELQLRFNSLEPQIGWIIDGSYGLPPASEEWLSLRSPLAVPYDSGDTWQIFTRFDL